jgi:hypothetical protein
VRIEEAGHDGSTAEINRASCRTNLASLPDSDDAPVLDRQGCADLAATVDELAVGEQEIGRTHSGGTLRGRCARRADCARRARDRTRQRTLEQIPSREHDLLERLVRIRCSHGVADYRRARGTPGLKDPAYTVAEQLQTV